jgi:hypothetical protein
MNGRCARVPVFAVACILLASGATYAQSAAARPNFNGVWRPYRGGRGADPKLSPPPASPLALKPEYAKAGEARRAAEAAANQRGEPIASAAVSCVPYGMPAMMSVVSYPVEITQTPKQLTIVTEAFNEVRRVFLDKPQEKIDDVAPGYYGRSVGHWDGDTLVVDTVGIKESVRYQNTPHSDQMRITERMHLITPDVLHDQITIEDPVVLEKPYTFTFAYRREPDYEMVEFICDNNREYVDEKGGTHLRTTDK